MCVVVLVVVSQMCYVQVEKREFVCLGGTGTREQAGGPSEMLGGAASGEWSDCLPGYLTLLPQHQLPYVFSGSTKFVLLYCTHLGSTVLRVLLVLLRVLAAAR